MKAYFMVLLLCLSLLFVNCTHAQAAPNNQNNFNDSKFGGNANQTLPSNNTSNQKLSSLNETLSNQTAGSHKTIGIKTKMSLSDTLTHTTPQNKILTNQTVSTSKTPTAQELQLLEKEYLKTGNTLFDQGNYTDAITYFDKALAINSTDTNALYNKALSFDNLGSPVEAIAAYDKVLTIHPNDTDALNNAGLALDSIGEHTKAISYYDRLLAINPEDTDALYNKGLALEKLGKKDSAILYYKKVLEVNPNDTAALNKLNLTFNNANVATIAGTHKEDQSLITVIVGVFIAILIGIIVIDRISKRRRHEYGAQVVPSPEVDETIPKDSETEEIGDEEWKGI